jgi:putative salt-induced outer membrane protein YdiY
MFRRFGICLALALAAADAGADELRFKNGDRFTGTVVSMAEGKLVFASVLAGKITLPMADLETFSTEGPVVIELDDGTRIQRAVEAADAGTFRIRDGGALESQSFVLARTTRINPEREVWHGALAAGAQFSRGNTVSDDGHADFAARRRTEIDRMTFTAGYLGARETKIEQEAPDVSTTTKRKLFGGAQYDYFLTKKFYGYTRMNAEKDGVAFIDLRFLAGAGVGWQVWELPSRSLSLESGLSWVSENYSDDTPDDDFLALRNAWNYDQGLTDQLRFFHSGEWFPGLEAGSGHLVKTTTGLRRALTDVWFVEAKLKFDWDSEPAEDADRTDVVYLLGAGLTF